MEFKRIAVDTSKSVLTLEGLNAQDAGTPWMPGSSPGMTVRHCTLSLSVNRTAVNPDDMNH